MVDAGGWANNVMRLLGGDVSVGVDATSDGGGAVWTRAAEKKLENAVAVLGHVRPQYPKDECRRVIKVVEELAPLLRVETFDYTQSDDRGAFPSARRLLLELWRLLLHTLDIISPYGALGFITAIVSILRRREFDLSHLRLDVHYTPTCSAEDMHFAHQYRVLLFRTQIVAQQKLGECTKMAPGSIPVNTYSFCAKVFAVTFFRLPEVSQLLASALDIPDDALKELHAACEPDFAEPEITNAAVDMLSAYPALFHWNLYHAALVAYRSDDLDEQFKSASRQWLEVVQRRDPLFWYFVNEWILHIASQVRRSEMPKLPWCLMKGYKQLVRSFLYDFKRASSFPKAMTDAASAFIITDPRLLSHCMRFMFMRTKAYDLTSVGEALFAFESWLKELAEHGLRVPGSERAFNLAFFCQALDIIIDSEHHQPIMRTLTMLYRSLDVFVGDVRKKLLCDFFLKKQFYRLFLHWDPNVRNTFHQILVFRMVRTPRTRLLKMMGMAEDECGTEVKKVDPAPLQPPLHELEETTDMMLMSKLQSYIRIVWEQTRDDLDPIATFPQDLRVYTPRAHNEYLNYTKRYYRWEEAGDYGSPPPLVQSSMLAKDNQEGLPDDDKECVIM